jgi:2-haloacid dehalogenase
VFDVGGVLVDGDYRLLVRSFFDDEAEVEHFLAEVLGEEFHLERDRGALMADIAAEWSRRYPEYESVIHEFGDRFAEVWRGPVAGSPEVLADLKAADVPVYGLTNWGSETWVLARAQFPFLDSFDGVLVSAEVGLIKPDPEIYLALCSRFGVAPERSMFIDDVERNVVAARALGFHGIVFTDAAQLRAELVECGFLT